MLIFLDGIQATEKEINIGPGPIHGVVVGSLGPSQLGFGIPDGLSVESSADRTALCLHVQRSMVLSHQFYPLLFVVITFTGWLIGNTGFSYDMRLRQRGYVKASLQGQVMYRRDNCVETLEQHFASPQELWRRTERNFLKLGRF